MTANTAPIPPEVEIVRAFVNTIDHDEGTEELDSPAALQRFLRSVQLIPTGVPASGRDLALALRLRAALRDDLAANHDGAHTPAVRAALDAVCRDLPLTAVSDSPGLAPAAGGVKGALAHLVAEATIARIKGTWTRLKICPADDCLWAFYDTSRNRSKRWCSMEVCGNRNKVRAFRDRSHA
jgi:predicted RNA-binding Zn ribbon-like protein